MGRENTKAVRIGTKVIGGGNSVHDKHEDGGRGGDGGADS